MKVAIIMGSHSDLQTMQQAAQALKDFGIDFEIKILSAHRTPLEMVKFAKNSHKKFQVIIAGAGGAAHLPGMVASLTPLPVIGVPVNLGKWNGLDSFLSIAQMPKGVPVATVGVDQAYNAGLLAARILSISNKKILKKIQAFQKKNRQKVIRANQELKSEAAKSISLPKNNKRQK